MAAVKPKPAQAYNTFTKSYRVRYVVHASRMREDLTLCGRTVDKRSRAHFDVEADGSCRKCIQKLDIESRIHPGWEEG